MPLRTQKNKVRIPQLKKGLLGKHGYKNVKNLSLYKRHNALKSAEKEYGPRGILLKLGAVKTLHKRKNPRLSNIYHDDMKWVRKKYTKKFKTHWKHSAMFQKK